MGGLCFDLGVPKLELLEISKVYGPWVLPSSRILQGCYIAFYQTGPHQIPQTTPLYTVSTSKVATSPTAEDSRGFYLVAEWTHFTLLGIVLPTIKLKVYSFGGL